MSYNIYMMLNYPYHVQVHQSRELTIDNKDIKIVVMLYLLSHARLINIHIACAYHRICLKGSNGNPWGDI